LAVVFTSSWKKHEQMKLEVAPQNKDKGLFKFLATINDSYTYQSDTFRIYF